MRNGSLPELCEVYDNIQGLTGRAPSTLRTFVERNRGAFQISSPS